MENNVLNGEIKVKESFLYELVDIANLLVYQRVWEKIIVLMKQFRLTGVWMIRLLHYFSSMHVNSIVSPDEARPPLTFAISIVGSYVMYIIICMHSAWNSRITYTLKIIFEWMLAYELTYEKEWKIKSMKSFYPKGTQRKMFLQISTAHLVCAWPQLNLVLFTNVCLAAIVLWRKLVMWMTVRNWAHPHQNSIYNTQRTHFIIEIWNSKSSSEFKLKNNYSLGLTASPTNRCVLFCYPCSNQCHSKEDYLPT